MSEIADYIQTINEALGEIKDVSDEQENEIQSLRDEVKELNTQLESIESLSPQTAQDELKNKVLCRLSANLSLEQLENLEQVVKNQFKGEKRNYILEIL